MTSLARGLAICGLLLMCSVATADFNPMKVMIRTVYPEEVKQTKGTLVNHILYGSGYKMYLGPNAPDGAVSIMREAPGKQRTNVLMTRMDALLMAIGDEHAIVIDHENKLVSVTRNYLYDAK